MWYDGYVAYKKIFWTNLERAGLAAISPISDETLWVSYDDDIDDPRPRAKHMTMDHQWIFRDSWPGFQHDIVTNTMKHEGDDGYSEEQASAVINQKILNFRLQQCTGSHQSIKEYGKEDTDLLVFLRWDESPLYIHSGSCYLKNSVGFHRSSLPAFSWRLSPEGLLTWTLQRMPK
jgi:hypothetical protein